MGFGALPESPFPNIGWTLPIHKAAVVIIPEELHVYWDWFTPIDNLPSSLLNESPCAAQKKSVAYRPMMKCEQAIIDSHCCRGGRHESPHSDGSGSHRPHDVTHA